MPFDLLGVSGVETRDAERLFCFVDRSVVSRDRFKIEITVRIRSPNQHRTLAGRTDVLYPGGDKTDAYADSALIGSVRRGTVNTQQ